MTVNVTVIGSDGAIVSLPFTSTENAAAAQAAANAISKMVNSGTLTQVAVSGATVTPADTTYEGAVVTVASGTGGAIPVLPANFAAVSDNSAGSAAFVLQTQAGIDPTVIGGGDNLTVFNQSVQTADVFFGSGQNSFVEFSATASGVIGVDGLAFIGATQGNTTVNAYGDAVVNIQGGGNATVNFVDPSGVVFVSGSSTVPVTINDQSTARGAGSFVGLSGGAALINPGSANVTVYGTAQGGSASVYGGTGSLSVLGAGGVGASGYYVGGAAGNNVLETSTVPGATTLVGAGNNDSLFGFGPGDQLRAGAGQELLATYASGDTLIAGSGASTSPGTGTASLFGANTGGNAFVFDGTGTETAYGAYGNNTVAANTFVESVGGGTITINDFRPGTDTFHIADGAAVQGSTFNPGTGTSPANTVFQLSDGTTVTFNYVHLTQSPFG